jgi:hypothetical protein
MHLLIPFAFCSSEACRQALPALKLPTLEKLLRRLTAQVIDPGDEASLSPPHERALAQALGLPMQDGLIPWAALQARSAKLTSQAALAWAFITPCHWQTGTKHVAMGGLTLPDFPAHESQALLTSMQAYFAEDGISLHADQPGRWLACGQVFQDLRTASLERVAGRDVAPWLPHTRSAIPLQRLQSEMQMLLYQHPVNDARAARGVPSVNSFWVSGTGDLPELLPTVAEGAAPVVVTSLRDAALDEDWPAWVQAWHALDGNECKTLLAALERGEDCQLTLCGERSARRFSRQRTPLLTRITSLFGAQRPSSMLEQL